MPTAALSRRSEHPAERGPKGGQPGFTRSWVVLAHPRKRHRVLAPPNKQTVTEV